MPDEEYPDKIMAIKYTGQKRKAKFIEDK